MKVASAVEGLIKASYLNRLTSMDVHVQHLQQLQILGVTNPFPTLTYLKQSIYILIAAVTF